MTTAVEKSCESLINVLEKKNKLDILTEIFQNELNFDKLFKSAWDMSEAHECLVLPPANKDINKKLELDSEKFRTHGNRLYKERKFDKALQAYNYAILSAPHPKNENQNTACDNDEYECLSLAFANRSALLFEMGEYSWSIGDIDRSILYGYPIDKRFKLCERKSKCFVQLKEFSKAKTLLNEISPEIPKNKAKLNTEFNKRIEDLKEKCQKEEMLINNDNTIAKNDKTLMEMNKYDTLLHTGPKTPPFPATTTQIINELMGIHQISDHVKINHSREKGRHLVAAKDIEPGTVLLTECANCWCVALGSKLRMYCTNCLRRAPIALPCPTCSLVVFCSEDCRKEALNGYHKLECPILPILTALMPDAEVTLALRLFTMRPFEEMKKDILGIVEKEKASQGKKAPNKNFLNGIELYQKFGNRYETLYNLEGNLTSRKPSQLIEIAFNSIILVKLLLKAHRFTTDIKGEGTYINEESIIIVGSQLMRLILNFQCNSHCMKELQIEMEKPIQCSSANTTGYAIFNVLSLVNHSCNPNVLNSNLGNIKYMYSISSISRGEEIVDSYGERFVSHNFETRQKNLKESYYFDCNCVACVQKWPMFDILPLKWDLMCLQCGRIIDAATSLCSNCTKQQNKKNRKKNKHKNKNSEEAQAYLMECWQEYEIAFKNISEFKSSNEIEKVTRYIAAMDKYTVKPSKPYIEAQETLLRGFDLKGSFLCN